VQWRFGDFDSVDDRYFYIAVHCYLHYLGIVLTFIHCSLIGGNSILFVQWSVVCILVQCHLCLHSFVVVLI